MDTRSMEIPGKGVRERRFNVAPFELREEDGAPVIIGHAAVFNEAADLGYFREIVAPGCFTRSIGEDDIRALWNHDANHVLGRNSANTLTLREDAKGLAIRILPPDTQMGRDLMVSMKRGDVTQMSFGFTVRAQLMKRDAEGNITRTLKDVRLYDVSPVTYPAYEGTDVSVRSMQELLEEFRSGTAEGAPDESWKFELEHRARALELARII